MAGWTPVKVAEFKKAFFEFLEHVHIDSKEKGGNYCLARGVYDAQHRFLNGVFDGLALDKHDFKVLKSRQLGISTISEALFVFFLGVIPGIKAGVILDTAPHLKSARLRIKNLISKLPRKLKFPKIKEDSREMLVLDNGSTCDWMAAGVRETQSSGGLGRSGGYNVIWASEVSSWKNDEGIQSLIETLSETFPDRLFIWESTARGYNHWRDMWVDAENDDVRQQTIFIGWWAHPLHVIERKDRRFERYGLTEPDASEAETIRQVKLRHDHDITTEQLAWYRWKIDPSREAEAGEKKGDQYKIQEQPSLAEDSFAQAGSSFFDHIILTDQSRKILTLPKSQNYKYAFGPEFPHTIIMPAPFWRDVQLRVWNPPEVGITYIIAGDPAYGRNPENDRSAAQVLACYADCVEQVAEFASPIVNTQQFAWVLASLAAWYKNVHMIIELDGGGEAVWKEYEGIPRLVRSPYLRQIATDRGLHDVFNNVRNYIFNRPDAMTGSGNNWHWKTGNRKEAIMESFKAHNNAGHVILKSMDMIEEMRTIARDGAAIEAPSHKHDDRTVSCAIGIRCWDDQVRHGLIARGITKQKFEDAQRLTTAGRYDVYMQNSLDSLFNRQARIAKQAARAAKIANMRRR